MDSTTLLLSDGRQCVVREADTACAAALCEFVHQIDRESDFLNRFPGEFNLSIPQEERYIAEQVDNPDALFLMVAFDERIVATAHVRSNSLKRFRHHAELGIAVIKEFWGLGLGRQLMQLIIDWAKQKGLESLQLSVFGGNDKAIALYRSLGFVEEGRRKRYVLRADGTYDDQVMMAKHLQT